MHDVREVGVQQKNKDMVTGHGKTGCTPKKTAAIE